MRDPLACALCRGHGCAGCGWTGRACPTCHGRRTWRRRLCPTCCEGNQVNPMRERRAMRAFLIRYAAQSRR